MGQSSAPSIIGADSFMAMTRSTSKRRALRPFVIIPVGEHLAFRGSPRLPGLHACIRLPASWRGGNVHSRLVARQHQPDGGARVAEGHERSELALAPPVGGAIRPSLLHIFPRSRMGQDPKDEQHAPVERDGNSATPCRRGRLSRSRGSAWKRVCAAIPQARRAAAVSRAEGRAVVGPLPTRHSARSASMGSRRAARVAGTTPASTPTPSETAIATGTTHAGV